MFRNYYRICYFGFLRIMPGHGYNTRKFSSASKERGTNQGINKGLIRKLGVNIFREVNTGYDRNTSFLRLQGNCCAAAEINQGLHGRDYTKTAPVEESHQQLTHGVGLLPPGTIRKRRPAEENRVFIYFRPGLYESAFAV
jgi:hypothetical protein